MTALPAAGTTPPETAAGTRALLARFESGSAADRARDRISALGLRAMRVDLVRDAPQQTRRSRPPTRCARALDRVAAFFYPGSGPLSEPADPGALLLAETRAPGLLSLAAEICEAEGALAIEDRPAPDRLPDTDPQFERRTGQ